MAIFEALDMAGIGGQPRRPSCRSKGCGVRMIRDTVGRTAFLLHVREHSGLSAPDYIRGIIGADVLGKRKFQKFSINA